MEDIKSTLLELLGELHPDIDFEKENKLITGKIIDSFDMVRLVTDVMDEFDVDILASDMIPENFDSVDAMAALINKRMA